MNLLIGFLVLFLLYQLAEANGQELLKFPGKPYSIFALFLLVLPAAHWVARWQGDLGLAAYGMGLDAGWWQSYLLGLGLGLAECFIHRGEFQKAAELVAPALSQSAGAAEIRERAAKLMAGVEGKSGFSEVKETAETVQNPARKRAAS